MWRRNAKRGEEGNDRIVDELPGRVFMVIRGHARAGSPAIPAPNLPQHRCQTSGTIAVPHEPKLRNPNYAAKVKEEIDKLLRVGFIRPVKQATWLSLIVVVPKENGKI